MSGMARASAPSPTGFIALYADYLNLRAKAAKGRATREELVALAVRLADALRGDADGLEIAAVAHPEVHSKAWAGAQHPLERVPRADCAGPGEGKLMTRVGRKWTYRNDGGPDGR